MLLPLPNEIIDLTAYVEVDASRPMGLGGNADVYKYKMGKGFVAVKVLRIFGQSSESIEKVSTFFCIHYSPIVLTSLHLPRLYTKNYRLGKDSSTIMF